MISTKNNTLNSISNNSVYLDRKISDILLWIRCEILLAAQEKSSYAWKYELLYPAIAIFLLAVNGRCNFCADITYKTKHWKILKFCNLKSSCFLLLVRLREMVIQMMSSNSEIMHDHSLFQCLLIRIPISQPTSFKITKLLLSKTGNNH